MRLVESAKQRGIKPTARLFATTVPTVRKWLRRFQQPALRSSSRALFFTILLFLIQTRCTTAQEKPLEKCKENPVGARAPALGSSQSAADHLRQKINFAPWWIYRNTLSLIFTPLKHAGFRGWTDYCSVACARGEVRHAVGGIDGMYTVDLALSAFQVNETETRLRGPRYLRVELFHAVKKRLRVLPRKGDSVQICGKLMWDADGFLELHPRNPDDIQFIGHVSDSGPPWPFQGSESRKLH